MNGEYELAVDTGPAEPARCHCGDLYADAACPDHGVGAFLRELLDRAAEPEGGAA